MSAATTTPHTPWPTVKLGDVCEINLGKTPPRGDFRCWDKGRETDNVWLSIADLLNQKEGKVLDSKEYITDFAIETTGISRVSKGTLLLSFKLTLGRTAIAGKNLFTNEAIAALPIKDAYVAKIDIKYLMVYFSHFDWLEFAAKDEKVLGKTLNKKKLSIVPIPLPPLEVQREIVAKVEAGLKEADGLVAHFKRLVALADDTFKAELDETFSTLNAPTVKLGDVCKIVNGFTPLKSNPSYWVCGTIPWFTIDDVRKRGRFIYETQQFITSEALVKNTERLIPPESVLLCCTASIGEYAFTKIPLTTNQQFNALIVKDEWKGKLLSLYLYEFSKTLKETLIRSAGKTTIHFVSVGKVSNISIPLPSLDIQREIVGKLEAVKARCERLKAEAERGLKAAEALRKAVLAEAFES